ncbi:nuclear transport factor 2 family protein [Thalassomonas sp. RHCl1]|uniref:YybH family protein n=1 Tax=Thalassomonas sp. RHCl1 TaxID=2995320 RepID=UPI00248B3176|nr:nuclear transport factor 2 family protein [Thalassomonas sp. RHCl1]
MNKLTKKFSLLLLFVSTLLMQTSVFAHGKEHHNNKPALFSGLGSEAAKVVKTFHRALQTGDEQTARDLLADDVLIFEGGRVERSAQQYASHHMKADIQYLKSLQIKPLEHQVQVSGDTAVSMYRGQITGSYNSKAVDRQSMETLVLKKHKGGSWKITKIHWSG